MFTFEFGIGRSFKSRLWPRLYACTAVRGRKGSGAMHGCSKLACACRLAAVPVGPHRRCGGTSVATHPNVWMHESPVSARSDSSGDVASNRKRSPAAAVPCARTCAQWYVSHNHRIACGRRSDTRPLQSSSANPTAEYISRAQTTRLQQRLAHSGKRSVTVACLVTLLISCDMGIFGTRCAHV